MSFNDIQAAFNAALRRAEEAQQLDAYLGVQVGANQWEMQYLNSNPSFPMVTLIRGEAYATSPAFNGNRGVGLVAGLPIKVVERRDSLAPYEIVGLNGALGQNYLSSGTAGTVPYHPHSENSGNRYVHPAKDFSSGRVQPDSAGASLYVEVFAPENRLVYEYPPGTLKVFFGAKLDLSASVPGSGLCRMVLVSHDPVTNALQATNGATMGIAAFSSLGLNDVALITAPANAKRLAGVRLKNGQTEIADADIFDVRSHIGNVALYDKLDATAAPGTGDDSADGFAVGSMWIDVTNDAAYVCLDATAGAAVWRLIPNLAAPGAIGGTTPAAGTFTTLTATGAFKPRAGAWGKVTSTATDYTVLATDYHVVVTSTAAPRTISLPAASGAWDAGNSIGQIYVVSDQSGGAGTNNITIDADGADTIDGGGSKVISTNYGSYTLQAVSSSAWKVF